MCGGTCRATSGCRLAGGLSPRVRGNQNRTGQAPPRKRSIPACAGEPQKGQILLYPRAVYPRVCGGTEFTGVKIWTMVGLSPRVRGNPWNEAGTASPVRSIPACAGEPYMPLWGFMRCRVYPRVCGGTDQQLEQRMPPSGLSPRVRGNLPLGDAEHLFPRSIPACAGEPCASCTRNRCGKVYPRVCGGTAGLRCRAPTYKGLSPRVRGNHLRSPGR